MTQAVVEERVLSRSTVRLVKGDITTLDVDAFVFYARPDLVLGSGVGTAISVRGGPSIQKELAGLGPLRVGDVAVSAAGQLQARHILHAVGPRFQEEDLRGKLRTTMLNALRRADEVGAARVAFPAMGAGFYGVPNDVSAEVMLDALRAHLAGPTGIQSVVICVLDTAQFTAFDRGLATLVESGGHLP